MKMVHGGFTVFAAAVAVAVLGGCKWVACGAGDCRSPLPEPTAKGAAEPAVMSFWKGKKVAFLGDSITDPRHVGCTANYWNYLAQSIGIDAYVYGVNGARSRGIVPQAEKAVRDLGDRADAVFVWVGTNDFNGSVPRGDWYETAEEETPRTTGLVKLPRRRLSTDVTTFRGALNRLLSYLKPNFPRQQIVLCTAIHRGFAQFGPKNIQPEESFPNLLGLYIDDYNDDIRQAGRIWSVPVLDLYERSGLLPTDDAYVHYFHDGNTDRLHPSSDGHERISRTMMRWMMTIPSDFK